MKPEVREAILQDHEKISKVKTYETFFLGLYPIKIAIGKVFWKETLKSQFSQVLFSLMTFCSFSSRFLRNH